MHTQPLEDYSFAIALRSEGEVSELPSNLNEVWPSYITKTGLHPKTKSRNYLPNGMLAVCFILPQTYSQVASSTSAMALNYSTIAQVAQVTKWATAATTPAITEMLFSNWKQHAESQTTLLGFPLEREADFVENEGDFMHLMHSHQFEVSICVTAVEQGTPDFYESDPITFIDEPFFI